MKVASPHDNTSPPLATGFHTGRSECKETMSDLKCRYIYWLRHQLIVMSQKNTEAFNLSSHAFTNHVIPTSLHYLSGPGASWEHPCVLSMQV